MPDAKLDGALARKLFALLGDDADHISKLYSEMLLAYANGNMEMLLNRLGLAQMEHDHIKEVLRLLSQGRKEEALKKVGMYGIR